MNKIVYFISLFFVFLFISACKNESQPEKTQKQQTIEKKEPRKIYRVLSQETTTTSCSIINLKLVLL